MAFEEIIILLLSIFLSILITFIFKCITKHFFEGWQWIFPISLPLGFVVMYFTTDVDNIWLLLKEMLLWAFVISMIPVTIKVLIISRRNNKSRRTKMWTETKEAFHTMKPVFKKKTKSKETSNASQSKELEDNIAEEGESEDGI